MLKGRKSFDKPCTSSAKNNESFCFFAKVILLLHIANDESINLKNKKEKHNGIIERKNRLWFRRHVVVGFLENF